MYTIDEAIARERQQAKEQRSHIGTWDKEYSKKCEEWAEEHEQFAEWLEELKNYRDKNKMVVRIDVENMDSIKDKIEELSKYAESQYNKAIDDFIEKVELKYLGVHPDELYEKYYPSEICKQIKELAEQLKAGGDDENTNQKESR